jgi:hypothetical protein
MEVVRDLLEQAHQDEFGGADAEGADSEGKECDGHDASNVPSSMPCD